MEMKSAVPFLAMVLVQFAQVALLVVSKEAISSGITNFTFVFYSNAIAFLVLLPSSFLVHRGSNLPPITLSHLSGFVLLGIIGFLSQMFGYAGIHYASANLASSMLNLIPGFTFILAIVFRMEKVDFRSSSTIAKILGTVVSVAGAFVVALYKGPTLMTKLSLSNNILTQPSDWIIGGLLMAIDCVFASMFIIAQAFVLKKYPAELTVMLGYCFVVAILSAITSLILEKDTSAWKLQPNIRHYAASLILEKDTSAWKLQPNIRHYAASLILEKDTSAWKLQPNIRHYAASLILEKDTSAWKLQPNIRLYAVLYSGLFGAAFQVTIGGWCVKRKGPLFVAMFHPMGIVIATICGVLILGDTFYFGSLVGSVVIVIGFCSVMWAKSKERKMVDINHGNPTYLCSEEAPLLLK